MAEAFQDNMSHNLCFGCGDGNELGLRLKSYWEGNEAVCTFQPEVRPSGQEVAVGDVVAVRVSREWFTGR